jgi:hypothetical protein
MLETSEVLHARLYDVLLDHLRRVDAHFWPGTDGLTVDAVVAGYPQAAAAGQVPGLAEIAGAYPELAGELNTVFSWHCKWEPSPPGRISAAPFEATRTCRLD